MSIETEPPRKRDSHIWERDPNDWYVEPRWCSERLFEVERFYGEVWDPACGLGRIVLSARAAGHKSIGTDVVDRGFGEVEDFTTTTSRSDNIVSNPPFGIAEKFARKALQIAERKVALLLPATWILGDKRSRWLATTPLKTVYFLTPRPSMPPGAVIVAGAAPGGGTVDYAWLVWERGYGGTPWMGWIRREA